MKAQISITTVMKVKNPTSIGLLKKNEDKI